MYDVNSIIARLQNGESADAIANEMAAAMNEALAQVQKQNEEAKRTETRKNEIYNEMGKLLYEYIQMVAPTLVDLAEDVDMTQLMKDSLEGTVETLTKAEALFQKLENCGEQVKHALNREPKCSCGEDKKKGKVNITTLTPDQAANEIAKFLDSLGV